MLRVGVLALQGDFEAHGRAIERLGHEARRVRTAGDLDGLDALVMPGGETTTMLKLIESERMLEPLAAFCRSHRVFGTCAGAILLATEVVAPSQPSLGVLDMTVERNAYGRQLDSFIAPIDDAVPELEDVEAVFIRAPIIRRVGDGVTVLARHDGNPVLVRAGEVFAATFHPEMTEDLRVLELVLDGAGA